MSLVEKGPPSIHPKFDSSASASLRPVPVRHSTREVPHLASKCRRSLFPSVVALPGDNPFSLGRGAVILKRRPETPRKGHAGTWARSF